MITECADTIGMNEEVIVDGHPRYMLVHSIVLVIYPSGKDSHVSVHQFVSCMPLSVSTIADRLSAAGWATSAYGK